MQINGQLKNQDSVYFGSKGELDRRLAERGKSMLSLFNLDANLTATEPILNSMEQVEIVNIFLDTNLVTIVCFLVILSTQLIYDLMISDVEERKFEYGLLRALGFKKRNLFGTIII